MFTPYPQSKIPRRPRPEDADDIRLGFFVQVPDSAQLNTYADQIAENDVVIIGYGDDRGVDRNGGRTGASESPDEIRKVLYSMTPGFESSARHLKIWDLGNFKSWNLSLNEAHEEARKIIAALRRRGARILTLGGGHDWAYPDFADFAAHFRGKSPQIINLDAHLDMRPFSDNPDYQGHSGTPFRKIMMAAQKGDNATALGVLGLQRHCNAISHLQWALGQRAVLQFLEDLPESLSEQWELVQKRLELSRDKVIALSIDMDVFDAAHAPGVSAPQAFGLNPMLAQKLIREYSPSIQHLGIYEYNPRFDLDFRTARLAAKLIHTWIYHGV